MKRRLISLPTCIRIAILLACSFYSQASTLYSSPNVNAHKNIKPINGGGTVLPAETILCASEPVTLTLSDNCCFVVRWEKQVNCTGAWIPIPGTEGLTELTITTHPIGATCYRAVGNNDFDLPSTAASIIFDPGVQGGQLVKQGTNQTSASICPNKNIVLKLKNFVGQVLIWQIKHTANANWVDIPGTQNQTTLTVNGSSIGVRSFFRCCIMYESEICPDLPQTAYSNTFKATKLSSCATPTISSTSNKPQLDNLLPSIRSAYPIPSTGGVTLKIDGATEGNAVFEIYNLIGRVIKTENTTLLQGSNDVTLDISYLANGIYIVKFKDNKNQQSSIKIIKQ